MSRLPLGKIPIEVLNATVLKLTGARSDRVATPPLAGLDFAAIRTDGGFMIVSADPVTGVERDIGRYAVSVSANDVATSGNRPQFAESVILLPEGADADYLSNLAGQIDSEAKRLGINVVGGHTEVTPALEKPIVVVTAFSFVRSYVSSKDARDGDSMMMTKTAGLEGTAVLSGNKRLLKDISIVEEAARAFETGCVRAMHDCTEGGVVGAAFEMSLASGVGFDLDGSVVPVAPRTAAICREFSIDPLRLIGSGSLLLAVKPGKEQRVERALSPVCRVTRVGRFKKGGRTLQTEDGGSTEVAKAPEDELWKALGRSRMGGHGARR